MDLYPDKCETAGNFPEDGYIIKCDCLKLIQKIALFYIRKSKHRRT